MFGTVVFIGALALCACSHDDYPRAVAIVRGGAFVAAGPNLRNRGALRSDPSLYLLADPRQLPRTVGLAPTDGCRAARGESSSGRRVQDTCEPPLTGVKGAPKCAAARPGYVLRFSRSSRSAATRLKFTSTAAVRQSGVRPVAAATVRARVSGRSPRRPMARGARRQRSQGSSRRVEVVFLAC